MKRNWHSSSFFFNLGCLAMTASICFQRNALDETIWLLCFRLWLNDFQKQSNSCNFRQQKKIDIELDKFNLQNFVRVYHFSFFPLFHCDSVFMHRNIQEVQLIEATQEALKRTSDQVIDQYRYKGVFWHWKKRTRIL